MMLKLFTITFLVTATVCMADDLSGFARLDQKKDTLARITIKDPGFEKGGEGWGLRPGATVEAGAGRSATHALKYERTDSKNYCVISTELKVKPGSFYRFGAWIKTENVTSPQGGGATVAMEFSKTGEDGKSAFLTGRYLKGLVGSNDWTFVSDIVRIPQNATRTIISLYIWKGAIGTAWFDDVTVQEQGANLWTAYTLNPFNTVTDGKCTVAVSHDGKSVAGKPLVVRMQIKEQSLAQRVPVQDGRAVFDLGKLRPGEYESEFMILDTTAKAVLYSSIIPLKVNPRAKPTVAIDHHGRTFVNEQLFMPIGVFTANLDTGMIDTFQEAGLNCVLPYSSMHLRTSREAAASPEEVVKVMDLAAAKGFKVIFSCKDIGSTARYGLQEWHGAKGQDEIIHKITGLLKGHPALLAWYINDEQPSSQIERITDIRRLFNRIDPDHPTYGVLYQFEDLPQYGATCDIIGIDSYPLGSNDMKRTVYAMKQTRLTGLPSWTVPQLSNINIYKTNKKISNPQNPSEEKMRSLVILEAIYGAKGFIFYKFEDLKSWKLPKDNFAKEWAKFKNVISMLKTLEPYIMSEYQPELLLEGNVVAARLRNSDGKSTILVCSIGPGPATARLKLAGDYHSVYGRTTNQGSNWTFKGEDISSDLLFEK